MPLRFTEADKWKQEWFQELNTWQKLMYQFMTDNCDLAGFMEINPKYNAFLMDIPKEQFIQIFESMNEFYDVSKDGKTIWLKDFLKSQKNEPLNKDNNAHKKIIKILKENVENFETIFPHTPLYIGGSVRGSIGGSVRGTGNDRGRGIGDGSCSDNGIGCGMPPEFPSSILEENI